MNNNIDMTNTTSPINITNISPLNKKVEVDVAKQQATLEIGGKKYSISLIGVAKSALNATTIQNIAEKVIRMLEKKGLFQQSFKELHINEEGFKGLPNAITHENKSDAKKDTKSDYESLVKLVNPSKTEETPPPSFNVLTQMNRARRNAFIGTNRFATSESAKPNENVNPAWQKAQKAISKNEEVKIGKRPPPPLPREDEKEVKIPLPRPPPRPNPPPQPPSNPIASKIPIPPPSPESKKNADKTLIDKQRTAANMSPRGNLFEEIKAGKELKKTETKESSSTLPDSPLLGALEGQFNQMQKHIKEEGIKSDQINKEEEDGWLEEEQDFEKNARHSNSSIQDKPIEKEESQPSIPLKEKAQVTTDEQIKTTPKKEPVPEVADLLKQTLLKRRKAMDDEIKGG